MSRPAAILDIDGTLVDTNDHHAIAWYREFLQSGVVLPLWRVHRHMALIHEVRPGFPSTALARRRLLSVA